MAVTKLTKLLIRLDDKLNNNVKQNIDIRSITHIALLFAISVILTVLESMIPPIPTLPPGVKLGLSNIIIMYSVFFLGKKSAFTILILKVSFVFITRGVMAFLLSFSGGLMSILIMILICSFKRYRASYAMISICAAVTHNTAQLLVSCVLLKSLAALYYLPILILSGIGMGVVTGILLRILLPAMKRINIGNLNKTDK